MTKKKILFVLPSLGAGGAERILSFIAQNVNSEIFESRLLINGYQSKVAYEIEDVHTTFLNKSRVLFGIPSIIFFLRKYNPNIVVSSIGQLNTVFGLMAPFLPNIKFIVRETSVISIRSKFSNASIIYRLLAKIAYRNIHAVICQSQDMAYDFMNIYKLSKDKIYVINNPITKIFPIKKDLNLGREKKYITIGRLSKEKGHLRILDILASVDHNFEYTIVGSGPDKERIFKRIDELGLSEKISHIPFTKDVGEQLINHDLFLQGSYVEGFPNAALESCVVGTPVIAFDVPGGTKEIVVNGINGFLVNNINEYIRQLNSYEKIDPEVVRKSVMEKFNSNKILEKYNQLFFKTLSKQT